MIKFNWFQWLLLKVFFGLKNNSNNTLNKEFKVYKLQTLNNEPWLLIDTGNKDIGFKWFYFKAYPEIYCGLGGISSYHNNGWIQYLGNGFILGLVPAQKSLVFPDYNKVEHLYGEVDLEELIKEMEIPSKSLSMQTAYISN